MNCEEVKELSPLWHSGELNSAQQKDFDAHLAACPKCGAELREQLACDRELRDAVTSEPADTTLLEARVMRRIAQERGMRWLAWGAAAAAIVAGVVLFQVRRQDTSFPVPKGGTVAPLFADAARDHTVEVVNQAARRWRTSVGDIAALETAQGISDADVRALEAAGYKLERAKVCRLGGSPYMHLVYSRGGREYSMYMKVRGGQSLPEASEASGKLQLASFAGGRVQAVIVTDAPRGECIQMAKDAEKVL